MYPPIPSFKKTRIAPTPSGFLHLGNILSFALAATLARKQSAKILLRIDDLDQARINKDYIQDIFDTLNFLEIPWDEGPADAEGFTARYSQLHRMGLYRTALDQLAHDELVFACTCSRSSLQQNSCDCKAKRIPLYTHNASWRLVTDKNRELIVNTYNSKTSTAILPESMNNFIVRKKDGFPAYQLTSVIDDLFYGIDMVIRGADLWESTLAQLELAAALGKTGFNKIVFHHHLLIKTVSGEKLSKSAGATSIRYLRENGMTAPQIFALITDAAGIKEPVKNWEELGSLVLGMS